MSATSSDTQKEQCFLSLFMDVLAAQNVPYQDEVDRGEADAPSSEESENAATATVEANADLFEGTAGEEINVEMVGGTTVYDNFVCVTTANPGSLINRMVSSRNPSMDKIFQLKPYEMAAVMPKIRIFKVFYTGKEQEVANNIEFIFKNKYDESDITSMITDKRGRGEGVGLKSFEWTLLGTNTAEVDNNIKATLKIFFQNFKDFANEDIIADMIERSADSDREIGGALPADQANFLDLIYRTSKYRSDSPDEYNQQYFRIKVILGWTVDPAMIGTGPGKIFDTETA